MAVANARIDRPALVHQVHRSLAALAARPQAQPEPVASTRIVAPDARPGAEELQQV
jgi:hypothetical protein